MATNPFQYFLAREASAKVRLLERNHSIAGFIDGLLGTLTNLCNAEGVRMEDIELRDITLSNDGHLAAKVVWR